MVDKPESPGEDTETDSSTEDTAEVETAAEDATDTPPADDPPSEDQPSDGLAQALAGSTLVAASVQDDDDAAQAEDVEPGTHDHDDHDHDDDHHDEASSKSLAARALTWLLLLLAGGGIALWGGPKIAPSLPNGLGPVKAWLMPGEFRSQQQISDLRSDLDTRLADLASVEASLDEGRVGEIASETVTEAIAASQSDLVAQISALSDQVAAADSADIEARLAQIETRVEGLTAQLEGLSGLNLENLTEEQSAALSGFASAVDGVRGEVSALAEQQGAISQRIDEVEASVARKLEEAEAEVAAVTEEAERAQSATVIRAALSTIEAALGAGEPYETTLAELGAEIETDLPVALTATASTGVSTLGALRTGFGDAAHAAIKADIRSEDGEGVASRLASFLESQVASRSLTPQDGPGTDAVLSRAEDALRRDNLAAAVEELTALPVPAREAMAGWISKATSRVEAMSAFADLKAALTAQN